MPYIVGCETKEKVNIRQEMNIAECQSIIQDDSCEEQIKELARETLEKWQNKIIDSKPMLLHAGYVDFGKDGYHLLLQLSDENFDIQGFIVKEYRIENTNEELEVEEKYPIFGNEGIGSSKFVKFSVRKDKEVMNRELWTDYQKTTVHYTDNYPPVLISLPSHSKKVYIYLYDSEGNVSNTLPLQQGGVGKLSNLRNTE